MPHPAVTAFPADLRYGRQLLTCALEAVAAGRPGGDNTRKPVPLLAEVRMSRVLTALVCLSLGLPSVSSADEKAKGPTKPRGPSAATLLADGLAQANKDSKSVFLAFGSPSCGWCRYLEKYHARPAVAKTLGKHLVFVKVDVVENEGGKELYKKYTPQPGGVPVWVILAADGKVLADSFVDGKKNVGFPYDPGEVVHYEKVLRAALPKLSDGELAGLLEELKDAGPTKK